MCGSLDGLGLYGCPHHLQGSIAYHWCWNPLHWPAQKLPPLGSIPWASQPEEILPPLSTHNTLSHYWGTFYFVAESFIHSKHLWILAFKCYSAHILSLGSSKAEAVCKYNSNYDSIFQLLNAYFVARHIVFLWIILLNRHKILWDWCYYPPYFIDERIEANRGSANYLKSSASKW